MKNFSEIIVSTVNRCRQLIGPVVTILASTLIGMAVLVPAPSYAGTQTWSVLGTYTFTAPASSVTVTLAGGKGGDAADYYGAGLDMTGKPGEKVTGTLSGLSAGSTQITIVVAGPGGNGDNTWAGGIAGGFGDPYGGDTGGAEGSGGGRTTLTVAGSVVAAAKGGDGGTDDVYLALGGGPSIYNSGSFAGASAGNNSGGNGFVTITWVDGDVTAPTVTAFSIPANGTSTTISISSFTATDNVAVTGYLVNESAVAPAAGAAGWTGTAPASYTFASFGSKTLYAWAKDAAGNVSTSLSATTILSDTTAPTVTAFTIPATGTSLTHSITSFTATDNVAVTGYLVNQNAMSPGPGAAGWGGTAPTSYTFTSFGAKTLFAWAKDAAGNVSGSWSATTTLTDATKPTVTAFTIPATGTSLTLSISSFTATDNAAVTGYLVNESAVAPAAGAAGWTGTAPATYTFTTFGTKTLYAWAKDAAGNVSTSLSATTTLTDATKPTVTVFTIPATGTSLTHSITSFTATDNVAVTGYLVNESAVAPAAGAAGWTGTAPASYTFTTFGAKTLYAWAKDAAGNVSTSRSATTTLTDATKPTVTIFTIPATGTSLTHSITSFTATDNVAVTGYLVNESAVAPAAGAAGWTGTAPASYTFTTFGAKTLYAWAKDAAGNVSASLSATTTLTDTTAPTVTAFTIPATGTSLTHSITSFTATDNAAVTGYLVNESAVAPTAGAAGWTGSAPTTYTFTTLGAKTLYAWAKDAAGNVSSSRSATTTLTDGTAPTVTAFTVPATGASLTVSITSFTASDNVAVTGYLVNENAVAPASGAAGWTGTAPTSYTFASFGSKTLYAWAKDAAGNVSVSRSATTIADNTPASVTAFTLPATSAAGRVSVTALTATDNVGVAGYLITESAIAPSAGAGGWSVAAPTSYDVSSNGTKTLYAWAKDAVGNISSPASATVTVSDTTAPTTTVAPAGGTYSTSQTVTLTSDEPATIYYTLDGSAPSTGSTVYSAPLTATIPSTLRFFAKDLVGNLETAKKQTYSSCGVGGAPGPIAKLSGSTPALVACGGNYYKTMAATGPNTLHICANNGTCGDIAVQNATVSGSIDFANNDCSAADGSIYCGTGTLTFTGSGAAIFDWGTLRSHGATQVSTKNGLLFFDNSYWDDLDLDCYNDTSSYMAIGTSYATDTITASYVNVLKMYQDGDNTYFIGSNSDIVAKIVMPDTQPAWDVWVRANDVVAKGSSVYVAMYGGGVNKYDLPSETPSWSGTTADTAPKSVAVYNDKIYVLSSGSIQGFTTSSSTASWTVTAAGGTFAAFALDKNGSIYVTNSNSTVQKFVPPSTTPVWTGNTTSSPNKVVVDSNDNIYVSIYNKILKFTTSSGTPVATIDTGCNMPILSLDQQNNLFLGCGYDILRIPNEGTAIDWAGRSNKGYGFLGIVATASGKLYTSNGGHEIETFTPNSGGGCSDTTTPTVTAIPVAGSYNADQSVALFADETATIYYTTDGSVPTTASTVYAGPITIASTTTLRYIAKDSSNNQSTVAGGTYIIDKIAPVSSISPAPGSYADTKSITLSCSDSGGSGCANTYYTTDGSVPTTSSTPYTGPFNIVNSATVKFFSSDGAGNLEAPQSAAYLIDRVAPVTTATPASGSYPGPQQITLNCSDVAGSGCQATYYSFDETGYTLYTAPIRVSDSQLIRYYSVDLVGNKEATKSSNYVIENTAPISSASPRGGSYLGTQNIILSANRSATIYYTLNGTTPTTASSVYAAPIQLASDTTLKFFARDAGGNSEEVNTELYTIHNDGSDGAKYFQGFLPMLDPCGSDYYSTATAIGNSTLRFCSTMGVCGDIHLFGVTVSGSINFTDNSCTSSASRVSCGAGALDFTGSAAYAQMTHLTGHTATTGIGNGEIFEFHETYMATLYDEDTDSYYDACVSNDNRSSLAIPTPTTTATPPGGHFTSTQTVTLTPNEPATIRYTLDGSDPTPTSTVYTGAITIPSGDQTTLKFYATDGAGYLESTKTENYLFCGYPYPFISWQGVSPAASLDALAADSSGNIYINTVAQRKVLQYSTGDSAAKWSLDLAATPQGDSFAVSPNGTVHVLLTGPDRIAMYLPPQTTANTSYLLGAPAGFVTADSIGNVYVSSGSGGSYNLQKLNGAYQREWQVALTAQPTALTSDTGGVYVATTDNKVARLSAAGALSWRVAVPSSATALFSDGHGALYAALADTTTQEARKLDSATGATLWSGFHYGDAAHALTGIIADNDGNIYAATAGYTRNFTTAASSERYSIIGGGKIALRASAGLLVDNGGQPALYVRQPACADNSAPVTSVYPAGGSYGNPITVSFSVNEVANTYYTLNGGTPTTSSTKYGAPFVIENDVTLKFFSVDAAGNSEAVQSQSYQITRVGSDLHPPTTTPAPGAGTYYANQNVVLSCADAESGCANTYYTLDGSEPNSSSTSYSGAVTVSSDTTVKFFSVDRVGNSEAIQTAIYHIDKQAPVTTATPAAGSYSNAITVTLATTKAATIRYTMDGSVPDQNSPVYLSPIRLTSNKTIKFFGTDSAGNAEIPKTAAYVIKDTKAPVTTATPDGGIAADAFTVTLSCSDGASGTGCDKTYYTTDGSVPGISSSQYAGPIAIASDTMLKFFSTDLAGNQETVKSERYQVCTGAGGPVTIDALNWSLTEGVSWLATLSGAGHTLTLSDGLDQATFLLSSNITVAGSVVFGNSQCVVLKSAIDCGADGRIDILGGTIDFTGDIEDLRLGKTFGATSDGSSLLSFAIFEGNNYRSASLGFSASAGICQDSKTPTTTAAPAAGSYCQSQTVGLYPDEAATVYYTTDGSTPTLGSEIYRSEIEVSSPTTIRFFARDNAGNQEAVKSASYVISAATPAVTATPPGDTYASNQVVTLSSTVGATIYFSTNPADEIGDFQLYSTPIAVVDGTLLRSFAVDNCGRSGEVRSDNYRVADVIAPVTSATPAGGNYAAALTVQLSCADSDSGCDKTYYTVNGSIPSTGSSVYATPIPITAGTILRYFSVDHAGNQEAVKSQTYDICTGATGVQLRGSMTLLVGDRVAAITGNGASLRLISKNGITSDFALKGATASGSITSLSPSCSLDTGHIRCGAAGTLTFTGATIGFTGDLADLSRYSATAISVGAANQLIFRIEDGLGNNWKTILAIGTVDPACQDTTPPATAVAPAPGVYCQSQLVGLYPSEEATVYYSTDGSTPVASEQFKYRAPFQIDTSAMVKYFAMDLAGNNEALQTASFTVNGNAPSTVATPPAGNYGATQSVVLTASGGGTTYFTSDGSMPTTASTVYNGPISVRHDTTLKFFTVNSCGAAETVRSASYTISDTTAPTTTATPPGGSYSVGRSVVLTCSDNQGGSGCDKTYYTTDGSTPTTLSTQYAGPIILPVSATLKYFSVDLAGNVESIKEDYYAVATGVGCAAPALNWTLQSAGVNDHETVNSIAYGSDQTLYLLSTVSAPGAGYGSSYWRLDKRDQSGNLLWSVTSHPSGNGVDRGVAVALSSNGYLYVAGNQALAYSDAIADTTATWRIEKYTTDGAVVGGGFPYTQNNSGPLNAMAVDGSYVYLAGQHHPGGSTTLPDYYPFAKVSVLSAANAALVENDNNYSRTHGFDGASAVYGIAAADDGWYMVGELMDGNWDIVKSRPGTLTPLWAKPGYLPAPYGAINSVTVDSGAVYVSGNVVESGGTGTEWRLQRLDPQSGSIVWDISSNPSVAGADVLFSVSAGNDAIYSLGYDSSTGNPQFRLERRDKADGALLSSMVANPSSGSDYYAAIAFSPSGFYLAGADSHAVASGLHDTSNVWSYSCAAPPASICSYPLLNTGFITDPVLTANTTQIRAAHISELRSKIDTLRIDAGLAAYAWTDPVLSGNVTKVRKVHVEELRSALAQVYSVCGAAVPGFTDPVLTANQTRVRKLHFDELRSAVRNAP